MAELIAQGSKPEHRWRYTMPVNRPFCLGRESGRWEVPWDDRISRRHALLCWTGKVLQVDQLGNARNPIFVEGKQVRQFNLKPGNYFVIGGTTFMLVDESVNVLLDLRQPIREQTFSPQYLKKLPFANADQRIEVLSRLPEVISGAVNDAELFVRVVNLLLLAVPKADAVAITEVLHRNTVDEEVRVLYWDRRRNTGGEFQPSQRLILEAVHRQESTMHVWHEAAENSAFTHSDALDWAFCTPVPQEGMHGWAFYITGSLSKSFQHDSNVVDPADLRDDIKFTELAAATLGAIRGLRMLSKQHASLQQFFSPVVLDALAGADPEVALAPQETDVTVMFCDLRGFSLKSERAVGDLMGLLHRVSKALGVVTHQILDHGGVVGDFQGDAVMGFWGWPITSPDAIKQAARAALGIRAELRDAALRDGHPLADFRLGIGIATGRAVAGKIGTVDQVKVTVFGPVVNLASRLEGMTKTIRAPILLDQTTAKLVRDQVPREIARCRRVAVVRPFGLSTALEVSELLPPEAEMPEFNDQHLADYEAALDALLDKRWAQAFELLHRVPAVDQVKDFLTVFVAQHDRTPPENWDGVIPLTGK